jgi:phosphoglycolate phosphatase-like HAD superfamily hydrolase
MKRRPSPHPGGLLKLAAAWNVPASEMVMVGDYRFDLDCGRAAGARTVLVNLPDNPWPELTDWHAEDCIGVAPDALAQALPTFSRVISRTTPSAPPAT